jgi:DNA-binding transcriptional ArsR family regulator
VLKFRRISKPLSIRTPLVVQAFRAKQVEELDVGNMARALNMDRGVLEYHLDRLNEAGLAETTGGNYLHGHIYWGLTPKGRQYVVERNLI